MRAASTAAGRFAAGVPGMLTIELSIQFFDNWSKIWIEGGDFDTSLSQSQLTGASNALIRIQDANEDLSDSAFDDPFRARNLRIVPRGARLKRREDSCAS
jgi:hypothetical protein